MRKVISSVMIGGLSLIPLQGCKTPEEPTRIVRPSEAEISHFCDFGEATKALYGMSTSPDPAIYVISGEGCAPCLELEIDLFNLGNSSRKVFISHIDPGSQMMINYANAIYGNQLSQPVTPSVIITHFDGETLFSQGYNTSTNGFNDTRKLDGSSFGPVTVRDLFR